MSPKPLFIAAFLALASPAPALSPEQIVENLANLHFDLLGHPQIKSDSIHPVRSTSQRPHRLLIIPVRFSDLGFDRFKGESGQDEKNRHYLDRLLFSQDLKSPAPKTLTHYYYHQSRGRYYVTGEVFPVVKVAHPMSRYGRPIRNSDGDWKSDGEPEGLVSDALRAAYALKPDFPWADYDIWDPFDYDGDSNRDEPDGYIDHFILVYAGKGQNTCHALYNLQEKFTANAPADLLERLSGPEKACAERIWPHRFSLSKNNGRGPLVEGFMNARGGIPVQDGLWVYDYNMQSEYTQVSTFIHEFGHSLGLPDIYARQTNNSTGSWDAMSSTADPVPQELSAWSRMVLGWLKPCVIRPRAHGGAKVQSVYLKAMNDWAPGAPERPGLCDAAMVLLPPKFRDLKLGPLGTAQGRGAAYTGQGNDLNRFLGRSFDLSRLSTEPVHLELDAWFDIETDWDYLYVEASTDGVDFARLLPVDKDSPADPQSVMPSKRGHDGPGTLPGFTGRSGDLDGDGKVESAPGCDPRQEKKLAEDRVAGGRKDPCEVPQWVHARFDLAAFRGRKVQVRFHYFTDMAAVHDGALLDNVEVPALGFREVFEAEEFPGWSVEGFGVSGGEHRLAVPQYYLLEYRDPYARFAAAFNYDQALKEEALLFFHDPAAQGFRAMNARSRSGVLAWYYNGSYLWSQNEPAENGPGQGFLLAVDSNSQEFRYPPVPESYFKLTPGSDGSPRFSHYEFDQAAQPWLRENFLKVMCFERKASYYPPDLPALDRACAEKSPPLESLKFKGRRLLYGYNLINEHLPGPEYDSFKGATSLYDLKLRQGEVSFRLYDRLLRNLHSGDAPFSLDPFERGVEFYAAKDGGLSLVESRPYASVSSFDDSDPSAYLNPKLPFGGAALPSVGLRFQLARPGPGSPPGAKAKVYFQWQR